MTCSRAASLLLRSPLAGRSSKQVLQLEQEVLGLNRRWQSKIVAKKDSEEAKGLNKAYI